MDNEKFLIDANSFITPHLQFYPFDFAKSFWSQIEAQIEIGSIVILDMVKAEVLRGNDNLKDWMVQENPWQTGFCDSRATV